MTRTTNITNFQAAQRGRTSADVADAAADELAAAFQRRGIVLDDETLATIADKNNAAPEKLREVKVDAISGLLAESAATNGIIATDDDLHMAASALVAAADEIRAEGDGVEAVDAPAAQQLPGMPDESDSQWGMPADAATKAARRYPVPQDSAFGDEAAKRAPDLEIIANRLIRSVRQLRSLAYVKIRFYWKKAGGSLEGIAKRVDPFLKLETGTETQDGAQMMIWLAADKLRERNASELYVERTLFDALLSIDADGKSGPAIAPPDFQCRYGTVLRYGLMTTDERIAGRVIEQAPTEFAGIDLTSSAQTAAEGPGRVEHDVDDEPTPADLFGATITNDQTGASITLEDAISHPDEAAEVVFGEGYAESEFGDEDVDGDD